MRTFYFQQNITFGILLSFMLILSTLQQRSEHITQTGKPEWTNTNLNETLRMLKPSSAVNWQKAGLHQKTYWSVRNVYALNDIRNTVTKE